MEWEVLFSLVVSLPTSQKGKKIVDLIKINFININSELLKTLCHASILNKKMSVYSN